MPEPPPIFLVGASRSGTGLLRDLLRSHPRLCFPPESHFIPAVYAMVGEVRSRAEAELLLQRLRSHPNVQWWGPLDPRLSDNDDVPSYASVVASLYQAYARRCQRPRWGDKTPGYVQRMPLLSQMFPQSVFIHLIRDGRDVALSHIRHPWGPHHLLMAGEIWLRALETARQHGARLGPDRYREVRYESLLYSPQETLRGLLEWLGEDFQPAVLQRQIAHDVCLPSYQRSGLEVAVDNCGKWRALPDRQKAQLQGLLASALDSLGYPLEGPTCRPSALAMGLVRLYDHFLRLSRMARPASWRTRLWMWQTSRQLEALR